MAVRRGGGGGSGASGGSNLQQCPLCQKHFHTTMIEQHASGCLGADDEGSGSLLKRASVSDGKVPVASRNGKRHKFLDSEETPAATASEPVSEPPKLVLIDSSNLQPDVGHFECGNMNPRTRE